MGKLGKRKSKKSESEEKKPRKKCKRRFRKLMFLVVSGGGAALALSEPLRTKLLDRLFGSEEQFQYTPPAPAPPADEDPSA